MVLVVFMLFSMRLNFFIDVVTGLVFGHLVYSRVAERGEAINERVFAWLGDEDEGEGGYE